MTKKRKTYRACTCHKVGWCPRYKRNMSIDQWELCQKSEKHRMLFDELAGNFYFGMVNTRDGKPPNLPELTKQIKAENDKKLEDFRKNKESKKSEISKSSTNKKIRKGLTVDKTIAAKKAIDELKKEGVTLKNLETTEEGLGDTIEKVLGKFGLTQKVMSKLAGRACSCGDRKKWLNKLLPYSKDDTPKKDNPKK